MKELTDDDLIAIARQAALDSTHRYSYMPAMPEDAAQWAPHRWVIEAMRAILAAPAVERQEPVDAIMLDDCEEVVVQGYGRGYFATDDCVRQVYTLSPALKKTGD